MKQFRKFIHKIGLNEKDAKFLFSATDNLYIRKEIPKKDGKKRTLFIPDRELKKCQKSILGEFSRLFYFPEYVSGGVKNRSIITNAKIHCNKEYVLVLDINDFFPSVKVGRIAQSLKRHFGFSSYLLKWITRIVSFNFCLPQGAPTSPFIANVSVSRMDRKISAACVNCGASYSRYFDDITISGDKQVKGLFLGRKIEKIISEDGFKMSKNKTKLFHCSKIQRVTGLVVNDGLSVDNKTIRDIETQIKNREFLVSAKQKDSITGKIVFIKSVDKQKGLDLERLFQKWAK
jgi:hypothetical protein